MSYVMIPLYRHAGYGESMTGMRLVIDAPVGAGIVVKSLITAVDTRHPINNAVYLQGCADFVAWTGDSAFLGSNIGRMIRALRFAIEEFDVMEAGCVVVPWVGHDGRSGLTIEGDGTKRVDVGVGVGNNYWDLLPFGGKDGFATLYLYQALRSMERLGEAIGRHPEWAVTAQERGELEGLVRPALAQDRGGGAGDVSGMRRRGGLWGGLMGRGRGMTWGIRA